MAGSLIRNVHQQQPECPWVYHGHHVVDGKFYQAQTCLAMFDFGILGNLAGEGLCALSSLVWRFFVTTVASESGALDDGGAVTSQF